MRVSVSFWLKRTKSFSNWSNGIFMNGVPLHYFVSTLTCFNFPNKVRYDLTSFLPTLYCYLFSAFFFLFLWSNFRKRDNWRHHLREMKFFLLFTSFGVVLSAECEYLINWFRRYKTLTTMTITKTTFWLHYTTSTDKT